MTERKWLERDPTEAQRIVAEEIIARCQPQTSSEVFIQDIWNAMWDAAVHEPAKPQGITADDVIEMFLVLIEEIRGGKRGDDAVSSIPEGERASMSYSPETGSRLIGPHGGLDVSMSSPTPADLADPLFNAIFEATKSWDVNVPEHYKGYCNMNGSHVMVILNAIKAMMPEQQ